MARWHVIPLIRCRIGRDANFGATVVAFATAGENKIWRRRGRRTRTQKIKQHRTRNEERTNARTIENKWCIGLYARKTVQTGRCTTTAYMHRREARRSLLLRTLSVCLPRLHFALGGNVHL